MFLKRKKLVCLSACLSFLLYNINVHISIALLSYSTETFNYVVKVKVKTIFKVKGRWDFFIVWERMFHTLLSLRKKLVWNVHNEWYIGFRESSGLRCRMCDHLQRMNDSLNEAYTNNIREKDRRIADLGIYIGEWHKNISLCWLKCKRYADIDTINVNWKWHLFHRKPAVWMHKEFVIREDLDLIKVRSPFNIK